MTILCILYTIENYSYLIVCLVVIQCDMVAYFQYSMAALRQNVQKEDKEVKSTSQHSSQKDAAKGFGGKYGVMKDRQDKVNIKS